MILKTNRSICTAISRDDVEKLAVMLKEGADVNAHVKGRLSPPITYCVSRGRDECLRVLLESGADINATDVYSNTALLLSAAYDRTSCMKILLKAGADVNIVSSTGVFMGKSPLHVAALRGYPSCVQLLLKAGANVNAKTERTLYSPLHLACQLENYDCAQVLIEAGADVNQPGRNGRTALHDAGEKGRDKCVELLIKAGADVNQTDKYGNPPLFSAFCFPRCVRLILLAGAHVNTTNKKGQDIFEHHAATFDRIVAWKTIRFVMRNERTIQEMKELHAIFAENECSERSVGLCLQDLCRVTIRKHLLVLDRYYSCVSQDISLGVTRVSCFVSYVQYGFDEKK